MSSNEVIQNPEDALKLGEEKFRTIADFTYDWELWEDPEGKLIYISPSCERITGYRSEEFISDPKLLMNIIHPEDQPAVREHFETLNFDKPHVTDFRIITRTGDVRWIGHRCVPVFASDGRWLGRRASNRDITDRIRVEEALAKAKDELEIKIKERTAELMKINAELQLKAMILDKATDAILLRGLDDIIVYANEAAYEIYGYPKNELQGMDFRSLINSPDMRYHKRRLKLVLKKGEMTFEGSHLRKDKSEIPVEIHSHLINIGDQAYILSVIRDITKRKQVEERVKQSELQFQKLFDAMNEGVALIDAKGQIIKANMAEAKMLGFQSPSEREGQHFSLPGTKHIYPDGTPIPPEEMAVSQAITKKRNIKDMIIGGIEEDGSAHWFNVNAVPLMDESGNVTGVVRTMTDITEQIKLKDEIEQFTRRLIAVQEEERKRIARELHDDTAQNLALLALEIDNLLRNKEGLPAKVVENLKKLKEDTGRTQKEVRRFSHELRPGVLEDPGSRSRSGKSGK